MFNNFSFMNSNLVKMQSILHESLDIEKLLRDPKQYIKTEIKPYIGIKDISDTIIVEEHKNITQTQHSLAHTEDTSFLMDISDTDLDVLSSLAESSYSQMEHSNNSKRFKK